jgi:hypothetical protein
MGVLSFIAEVQAELERHIWDNFSEGRREDSTFIVMPGCPVCKKRLYSQNQFMHHLIREVLPRAVQVAIEKEKADKAKQNGQ